MFRSIREEDYKVLLELDRKVYPTDSPVTPQILNQWFESNPEFGIIFEDKGKMTGMLVIIPLSSKGWDLLISGEKEESDMKDDFVFNPEIDKAIGLHGYHLEKFTEEKGFFEISFKALQEVLDKISNGVKVLGFSGYAVTTEGISLTYNKLNMRERNYISNEHIMSKAGKLEIVAGLTQKDLRDMLKNGYVYHNRCKQLVTYPDEVSLVWEYLNSNS